VLSPGDALVVTGGIGSGKSTAVQEFDRLGWTVIDADALGHRALALVSAEVLERFPGVATGDGGVDRRALSRIVFGNPRELAALESIVHPVIKELLRASLDQADWPAAVEISAPTLAGRIPAQRLVIDTPESLRVARINNRGMEPSDLGNRLSVQPSRAGWLAMAAFVIDNGGPPQRMTSAIRALNIFWRRQ
jgi:dephospho-CoA kinase